MTARGRFVVRRRSSLPPAQAFAAVLDLREHSRLVPLTTIQAPDELAPGARFVARTQLGPLRIDDEMEVTVWHPPHDGCGGSCRIIKQGRWLGGEIDVVVRASGRGSELVWRQEVLISWLPAPLGPVAAGVARIGYRSVIGRLLPR